MNPSTLSTLREYTCLNPTQTLDKLNTRSTGLTPLQITAAKNQYGNNIFKEETHHHVLTEYLNNFNSPLVIVLVLVAAISYATGELVDGSIVLVMIFLSVTLNFIQEYKAGVAAQKLKEKVASVSCLVRAGKQISVPSSQVYPGDILVLNAGDKIPADARVIDTKDFFVNQSALTGESFPVEKHPNPLKLDRPDLTDMTNLVFAGTNVITGTASAVVIATGMHTQFGHIAGSLTGTDDTNEFTTGINSFSRFILKIIIIFVLFIFTVNSLIKGNWLESLAFSIAVAVGLTPEFLPMIMSVTMGIGSVKMAKKGVIVKKLAAIPTFGSIDILCTDKTGTLTQDHIQLVKHLDLDGHNSDEVLNLAFINSYYQTGITNPLDQAVIDFHRFDLSDYTKVDEIPFDFVRKRLSIVVKHQDKHLLISKGAPEEILSESRHALIQGKTVNLTSSVKAQCLKLYHDLSRQGYRVLALATRNVPAKHPYTKVDEADTTILGFMAFLDPPKPDANHAVNQLEAMGIQIKVITGDNELLAQKVCTDVGIDGQGVILGHEIEGLSRPELLTKIQQATIFARFSPDQKNRVITAFRNLGHVVGYMGDGINDAPSLKSADVGISVSNAVDVAKESADFILTRKSLHQLIDGVIEGRKTFGNTMKYIMMGLSSNFGNMFSVLGAVLFLPFLPMLPIQILLNNFLYDLSQLTLPLDKVDASFTHKPKRWDMRFIRRFMLMFGPISSVFDFLTFYIMYRVTSGSAASFQTGWFMESLATQTLVIHVIRTRMLPVIQSRAHWLLTLTTFLSVGIGWSLPYTPLGRYFNLVPLSLPIVGLLALIVVVYLVMVETGKQLFYRRMADI